MKYRCIRSLSLFERLERENAKDFIDDLIFECVSIKRDVVENDERDTGERAILNFGHTLGHAIEKLGNYTAITHGEAVAAGAMLLTRITEQNGMTAVGISERLQKLLVKYGLPIDSSYPLSSIVSATQGDKKSTGKDITLVCLKDIGSCYLHKIPTDQLTNFFRLT